MNALTRHCPACDNPGPFSTEVVHGKEAIGGRPFELATCPSCGLRFQPTVPSDEELAAWYDYMGQNAANYEATPLLQRRLTRIVSAFDGVRSTGRLLEIGCGGGLFAHAALASGWELWGTEISPSCAALLRPLLGDHLHQGTIEDAPFPTAHFDGAVLIEVIEHLTDPARYIEAIRRFLRPGGRLFLTTPNGRGSAARVLGTSWRVVADEHLSYFDARSIETMLTRHGFGDVDVKTSNLDLLSIAAQRAKAAIRRGRRDVEDGESSASYSAPSAPKRSSSGTTRIKVRTALADAAINSVNWIANAARLGDTLRVTATRTS